MRRALPLLLVPVVALLAGCAPTVSMTPAPQATSVRCAGVIVRLPDAIDGAARRTTDAQATAAWGVPASVTLTCGITTPDSSAIPCQTIDGVDWLLDEQRIGDTDHAVLTTFGRDPGTQVVVDPAAVSTDAVLGALSEPIATATRRTGVHCLAPSDAPS